MTNVLEESEMQINPHDLQTAQVLQEILFLITNYPEAKLVVDYDKEIVMILPLETRLTEDEKNALVRLGWENLDYYPYMWQYVVEGTVAEYYINDVYPYSKVEKIV